AVSQPVTEDSLAYFRDAAAFRNYTLLELPHTTALAPGAAAPRDYAVTIARNFLYGAFMVLAWGELLRSSDAQLAAIAERSLKEARYHLRHSRDWLVRLGDGTAESHERMQAAIGHLMPYTQEFWTASAHEARALEEGAGFDAAGLRTEWDALVDDALAEAGLSRPAPGGHVPRGKERLHSEHLGWLLGEMQSLARQHPGATW
ncbi:MAG: 1,2-phenylacetyl-CoA epoxidase subunit PaaC, partial [Burkholderiaceae bacterium]